jgi:hypothetical protein
MGLEIKFLTRRHYLISLLHLLNQLTDYIHYTSTTNTQTRGMVAFPGRMVGVPDGMVGIPDGMVGIPGHMVSVPDGMVGVPGREVAFPDGMVGLRNRMVAFPASMVGIPGAQLASRHHQPPNPIKMNIRQTGFAFSLF